MPRKFHHQANYYKLENEILRAAARGGWESAGEEEEEEGEGGGRDKAPSLLIPLLRRRTFITPATTRIANNYIKALVYGRAICADGGEEEFALRRFTKTGSVSLTRLATLR